MDKPKGPRRLKLEAEVKRALHSCTTEGRVVGEVVNDLLAEDESAEMISTVMDEIIEWCQVIKKAVA